MKKGRKRRILALLLCVFMLMGSSVSSLAGENVPDGGGTAGSAETIRQKQNEKPPDQADPQGTEETAAEKIMTLTAAAEGYEFRLSGPLSSFPEGEELSLSVEKADEETTAAASAAAAEQCGNGQSEMLSCTVLNISLLSDGEKAQLSGPAQLELSEEEPAEGQSENTETKIYYVDETGGTVGENESGTNEEGWAAAAFAGNGIYVVAETTVPDQNTQTEEEETDNPSEAVRDQTGEADADESEDTVSLDNTFHYENQDISVTVHIDGTASFLTDPADPEQGAEMRTESGQEGDPRYEETEAYAEAIGGEDGVVSVSVEQLGFYYQDRRLDVSGCSITAEIEPGDVILAEAARTESESSEEPSEGIMLAALQSSGEETRELGSVLVEKDSRTAQPLTVAVDSADPVLMVAAARSAADPEFSVQYYANLDAVSENSGTSAAALSVIDTSGGKLPANGTTPDTKNIYLVQADNGKYEVAVTNTLTEVYSEHQYTYSSAPGLQYFNRLGSNGNYKLKEIWVLKEGKNAASTSRDDWDVYSELDNISFTNNQASADESHILIQDNTVIRLVYDPTETGYTNAVNFYDYDITSDGTYTYQNGSAQGINSPGNYSGSGAKLAFGNANTGTGLQGETWNGNTLNQYNRNGNGYQGCTFGLVTGLDDNGNIQYADGVTAPRLFNDGDAAGKTIYGNGEYSLQFNRSGDTYTLSAVTGSSTAGLQYFNNPTSGTTTYDHIWTNNFWPMDEKYNTDPHTGNYNNRGEYVGVGGNNLYPPSDDGIAHNNMFGMQYVVQFELTEDYTGPLEYYFFGDDDMWVFLDGKLVCDIGGVHRSVGEYLNLWDYIDKGTSGTHTLSFFYTERGLSGSTCYMQFTLPSVSSATPGQETGTLTVEKQVEGQNADPNQEFVFTLTLADKNNNTLADTYAFTRYKKDNNTTIDSGSISSGGTFELRADEYITIRNLPYGTKYTVEEQLPPGYTVSTAIGSTVQSSETPWKVSGEIGETNSAVTVVYTNHASPKLPDTGGPGLFPYTFGGAALMALSWLFLTFRRKRT